MKNNIYLHIALIVSLLLSNASLVMAEENAENTTLNNIKKVIQEKKVELGTGASTLRKNQAYLAKIVRVSAETLTVSVQGVQNVIPLDSAQVVQDGKEITIDKLAVDSWVGVFEEMTDTNNKKINKIVAYSKNFQPKERIVTIGSLKSVGRSDISIAPRNGEAELKMSLGKNSVLQDMSGETAKFDQFYEDLQCLVIAFADDNGNYMVSTMRALSTFEK
jgi:hypothetical protein